jgi:hypothetical protein
LPAIAAAWLWQPLRLTYVAERVDGILRARVLVERLAELLDHAERHVALARWGTGEPIGLPRRELDLRGVDGVQPVKIATRLDARPHREHVERVLRRVHGVEHALLGQRGPLCDGHSPTPLRLR